MAPYFLFNHCSKFGKDSAISNLVLHSRQASETSWVSPSVNAISNDA